MATQVPFPGTAFFHKGQKSPVITAMGRRLVAEGCGKYRTGPGPEWTDVDRQSFAAWQRKLKFEGADADGIPGKTSWDKLHVPATTTVPSGRGVASPVPGHGVTTPYRMKGPRSRWSLGYHTGADYAAPQGKSCVAVLSGTVRIGHDKSFGDFLVLRAGGFDYWYCHLSDRTVTGGSVKAGQKVGEVGHTGNANGPHLHLEKRPAGGGFGSDVPPNW